VELVVLAVDVLLAQDLHRLAVHRLHVLDQVHFSLVALAQQSHSIE